MASRNKRLVNTNKAVIPTGTNKAVIPIGRRACMFYGSVACRNQRLVSTNKAVIVGKTRAHVNCNARGALPATVPRGLLVGALWRQ